MIVDWNAGMNVACVADAQKIEEKYPKLKIKSACDDTYRAIYFPAKSKKIPARNGFAYFLPVYIFYIYNFVFISSLRVGSDRPRDLHPRSCRWFYGTDNGAQRNKSSDKSPGNDELLLIPVPRRRHSKTPWRFD